MNNMNEKYLDKVPVESNPCSIQNVLENANMTLGELEAILNEIWRSLSFREETDREGEQKITDLATEAEVIAAKSKRCAVMANEIFMILFGQH